MVTELVDKEIFCQDCKEPFVFSKGEQSFFLSKNFAVPKRCPDCRKSRRKVDRKKRNQFLKEVAPEGVTDETAKSVSSPAPGSYSEVSSNEEEEKT